MECEVVVPAGCPSGSEIFVAGPDGCEIAVIVPDGVTPGDVIIVELPPPLPSPTKAGDNVVNAVVPDDCEGGSEIVIDVGNRELTVIVPHGLRPGDVMEVTVPDEGPSLPPSPFVPGGSKSLSALNQPEPAPAATSIPAAKSERVLPSRAVLLRFDRCGLTSRRTCGPK